LAIFHEILPYCSENETGVIIRGVLAVGILTGKLDIDSRFQKVDFRRKSLESKEENKIFQQDLAKVEQLKTLARDRMLAQLALQFTIAHPAVTTVISGIKNEDQLKDNLSAAVRPKLTEDEMVAIDEVTPSGGGRKIWPA